MLFMVIMASVAIPVKVESRTLSPAGEEALVFLTTISMHFRKWPGAVPATVRHREKEDQLCELM